MPIASLDPKRWKALLLLCAAQFIVILDTSIIGVALPAIQTALGFTAANLQWVFNAYVIIFGGLLLLGGRLADLFGRRRLFMAGFIILTLSSLLAGLAWSDLSLIVARGLQGLSAAFIAPAALSLVMSLFPDQRELRKALGFWGASAAAGGSAGVFLGGVITQWLTWRWTFLINVPLGLLVLGFAPGLLRKSVPERGSVDVAGALTVTGSLILAVYAIVSGEGASGQTFVCLGVAAALFIAFLVIQSRRREPLMPFCIFKAPNLAAGNVVMALLAAAWIPLWFFLNLYLQQVLGYSALQGGLALLPMTAAIMALMSGLTGRVIARIGFKSSLVAGLLLLAGALVLFARAPLDGTFLVDVLPASLMAALAMSLAYIPATMAGMSGASPEETGLASGLINTSYQVGSALGLAAMVALAANVTAAQDGMTLTAALTGGFRVAFLGAGAVAFAAALTAAVLIRQSASQTKDSKLAAPV